MYSCIIQIAGNIYIYNTVFFLYVLFLCQLRVAPTRGLLDHIHPIVTVHMSIDAVHSIGSAAATVYYCVCWTQNDLPRKCKHLEGGSEGCIVIWKQIFDRSLPHAFVCYKIICLHGKKYIDMSYKTGILIILKIINKYYYECIHIKVRPFDLKKLKFVYFYLIVLVYQNILEGHCVCIKYKILMTCLNLLLLWLFLLSSYTLAC